MRPDHFYVPGHFESNNSLDIDFIHNDIHNQSCKKYVYKFLWLSIILNAGYDF